MKRTVAIALAFVIVFSFPLLAKGAETRSIMDSALEKIEYLESALMNLNKRYESFGIQVNIENIQDAACLTQEEIETVILTVEQDLENGKRRLEDNNDMSRKMKEASEKQFVDSEVASENVSAIMPRAYAYKYLWYDKPIGAVYFTGATVRLEAYAEVVDIPSKRWASVTSYGSYLSDYVFPLTTGTRWVETSKSYSLGANLYVEVYGDLYEVRRLNIGSPLVTEYTSVGWHIYFNAPAANFI